MKFDVKLIENLILKTNVIDLEISSMCDDHRNFNAGSVFFAIKGSQSDGHHFISELLPKKPLCIFLDNEAYLPEVIKNPGQLYVLTKNNRLALDVLAHHFYNEPSKKLFCAAVTGTSGKTTVSYMVAHLLNRLHIPTGIVGTIQHSFRDKTWLSKTTTPGSLELYSRLNDFVSMGAQGLSIEASSHSIDQHRIASLDLDVAIFTNLSRDHLDYHGSEESYFAAKDKLFSEILRNSSKKNKYAIINSLDPFSSKIKIEGDVKKMTYGAENSDLSYDIIKHDFSGVQFQVRYKKEIGILKLNIPGNYNVLNALAAIGVGIAAGKKFQDVVGAMDRFSGVRGRLEPVGNQRDLNVFVDYAHKPDALDKVLRCLNDVRKNLKVKPKIITVFGCGGDRDKGKRPLMAKIAEKYSDITIVTSDNPRTEVPENIISEIMVGFSGSNKNVLTEVDRRMAIKKAIEIASSGDVILIAGKGHETYQVVGTQKFDFDDVKVVQSLI